jgi:CDP-paratose 2-epimerase
MNDSNVRTALITGGAGFIGSNLAERLLSDPKMRVRILDNLSRTGVTHNLRWLRSLAGASRLEIVEGDVCDARNVERAAKGVSEVYHLAAQVAVTTSVNDPAHDFEVNARGTFQVLEAARRSGQQPFLLFTSTNKVYGSLPRLAVEVAGRHYRATERGFRGIAETEPLDFHSPYGCSKGAADQYVRDYARIYDLPTVVFRMSCIAGPRQFGNEDQGWVAHFLYSVLGGSPITIYGDGCQVRDVLHVYDLIDAMMAVRQEIGRCRGEVFNVGGGMERAISVLELLEEMQRSTGKVPRCCFREVRPGDQPLYISDTRKLQSLTGWQARRSLSDTLQAIHHFWQHNRERIAGVADAHANETAEPAEMEVA